MDIENSTLEKWLTISVRVFGRSSPATAHIEYLISVLGKDSKSILGDDVFFQIIFRKHLIQQ